MPDSRQGLTDIGMDSLMAVELSNRLQAGVEQSLPSTLAFEQPTIEALTIYLANEVLGLQTIEAVSDAIETDDKAHMLFAEIEELSDSEAEDSLLKELEEAGY
jgi:acyl carrier protein